MKNKLLSTAGVLALCMGLAGVARAADMTYPASPAEPTFEERFTGITSSDVAFWGTAAIPGTEEDDDFRSVGYGAGFQARTLYHYDPSNGIQFEGYGDFLTSMDNTADDDDDEKAGGLVMGGAHFIHRNETTAWGLFAGFAQAFHLQEEDHATYALGGLEHAWIHGDTTLTAQGGGLIQLAAEGEDEGYDYFVFGELNARHFLSPNSSIGGMLAAGFGVEDEEDVYAVQWGADVEHALNDGPFAVFAAYEGYYINNDHGEDWAANHEVNLGIRMSIGATSSQQLVNYGSGTFSLPSLSAPLVVEDDID